MAGSFSVLSTGPLPPDARFDIGPVRYRAVHTDTMIAIPMSDGAILCADLFRPSDQAGMPVANALPVVVNFTAYNRMSNRYAARSAESARRAGLRVAPSDRQRFGRRDLLHTPAGGIVDVWATNRTLTSRGYAVLVVDVRGTGSSTGTWDFFSPREHQDYLETLRWVGDQQWCSGRLGVTGISYGAIAALIVAGLQPPSLDAVFAIEAGEDPIRELGFTGGVPTIAMGLWLAAVNIGKWVPSPRGLISNQVLLQYLRDRFRQPASWLGRARRSAFTEGHPDGFLNDQWAARLPDLEKVTAATWIHGAWHDVYNRSIFNVYDRIGVSPGNKQVLVDDGFHMTAGCGFGDPQNPQRLDELQCAWFDRWLKDIDNGIDRYGPITVRRQGDGWVSRQQFPDHTATVRRLYLSWLSSGSAAHAGLDASLQEIAPVEPAWLPLPKGRPRWASNNTAIISMGLTTLLGQRFGGDDRGAEEVAATFTTEPFAGDVVLSGPLNLHLRVVASGTEAFWSVTVCDVEPTGKSAVLTRGALLSSLRAVDEHRSTYVDGELVFPVHTLRADSVTPVVAGEPFDIDIEINPTEALLRAGHRLRIAIAPSSFPRHHLPRRLQRKIKEQCIVIDTEHPSYVSFLAVGQLTRPASPKGQ